MKLASSNEQLEQYLDRYITVTVNGSARKFLVQKSNKFTETTGCGLLDDESVFTYTIDGESVSQTCSDIAGLSWEFTYSGLLNGNPWTVTNPATSVRFDIEDSLNCGGLNDNVQLGTATASISTGARPIYMNLEYTGLAEDEDEFFENMSFFLNNVKVASATSHNYDLGCSSFSPPQTGYIVNPPYVLSANTVNEFLVDFTTQDPLFHLNCFYQTNLSFFYDSLMTEPADLT